MQGFKDPQEPWRKLRPSHSVDTLNWRTKSAPLQYDGVYIPAGWTDNAAPVAGDWKPPAHITQLANEYGTTWNNWDVNPPASPEYTKKLVRDPGPIRTPANNWNSSSSQKDWNVQSNPNQQWQRKDWSPANDWSAPSPVSPSVQRDWNNQSQAPTIQKDWNTPQSPSPLSPSQKDWRSSNEKRNSWTVRKADDKDWKQQSWKEKDAPWQKEQAYQDTESKRAAEWVNKQKELTQKDIKPQVARQGLRRAQSALTLKPDTKRPTFPPPNRFLARQLPLAPKRESAAPKKSIPSNGGEPIGIFLWGFSDKIKVKDLMEAFSTYGEMINVGMDVKNGIKYAFIDYELPSNVNQAFQSRSKVTLGIPEKNWFGMTSPLQVRLRYDKTNLPSFDTPERRNSFDSTSSEALDYKSIHISNVPHNINKPEIEQVMSSIGQILRIKIYQRSVEKKSSVFVAFKTIAQAKHACQYLNEHNLIFKEMKEPLQVEYPTQDITHRPPAFATTQQASALSKKARKQLAAENCIVYVRSLEPLIPNILQEGMGIHGNCSVFITKTDSPSTAFVKFDTPQACAAALAEKTMGAALPRHKRVDIPGTDYSDELLYKYFENIAEVKQITRENTLATNITTVEFLTALGAAKAIVKLRSVGIDNQIVFADYTPSVKVEEAGLSEILDDFLKQSPDEQETIKVETTMVSIADEVKSVGDTCASVDDPKLQESAKESGLNPTDPPNEEISLEELEAENITLQDLAGENLQTAEISLEELQAIPNVVEKISLEDLEEEQVSLNDLAKEGLKNLHVEPITLSELDIEPSKNYSSPKILEETPLSPLDEGLISLKDLENH
ncbi:hypothetical protein HDV04_001052 [Boothiomyces sp. JEL0838]|nr:hypothetical protein HDV04_001052 [Boothiomyces sp. JEL0838]